MRIKKVRKARNDTTCEDEAAARVADWGYDPLLAPPGYTGFAWHQFGNPGVYADQLMEMAHTGVTTFPEPSALIPLRVPPAWPTHSSYLAQVNQALDEFGQ